MQNFTKICTILLLALCITGCERVVELFNKSSSNADAEKFLDCDGTWSEQGIAEPSDVKSLHSPADAVTQKYIVGKQYIIVKGDNVIKDDRLPLCEVTSSSYKYAWDCAVKDVREFTGDWIDSKDNDTKTSPFFKKWLPNKDSILGAKIVVLDRTNLTILDETYNLNVHPNFSKSNGKMVVTPNNYVIIYRTSLNCKEVKQKI